MANNASGWGSETAPDNGSSAHEDETLAALECMFEPPVDAICPFGNIVLVVDHSARPTHKFKVSSCILATVSPVFRAMFSKNFAEGQNISGDGWKEIRLEEDPEAVRLLCQLLHHRTPDLMNIASSTTGNLFARDILTMAILADKYDCVEAMRMPVRGLFDVVNRYLNGFQSHCTRKHFDLAAAAYILDQPEAFRDITKALVLHSFKISPSSFDINCDDFIPSTLACSLDTQRQLTRDHLVHHIAVLQSTFCLTASEYCKMGLISSFSADLNSLGLFPLKADANTLFNLLERFEQITVPILRTTEATCACSILSHHYLVPDVSQTLASDKWVSPAREWVWRSVGTEQPNWHHTNSCARMANHEFETRLLEQKDVVHAAKNIRDCIVGLCLDCIKEQREGTKACRVAHKAPWQDPHPDGYSVPVEKSLDLDCFSVVTQCVDDAGWGPPPAMRTRQKPSWWESAW